MSKKLESYIHWYKCSRQKFISNVYIDKDSWVKKKLLPYSNWDSEVVLSQESDFVLDALAELNKLKLDKNVVSLAVLVLSNRAEYISDQSDFYTTYAALATFSLAVISVSMSIHFKVIFSLVVLGAVIYCLYKRLVLRTEVAMNKEIVNLLKQYELQHA